MRSYDSTAYDFDLFTEKEKREVVEIPTRPARGGRRSRKAAARRSGRSVLAIAAAVSVFLLLMVAQLHCQLQTSEVVAQINATEREIEALKSDNVRLQVELERKVSFENMEQSARAMGMQKISAAQREYVQLHGEDAVEMPEQDKDLIIRLQELF